MEIPFPHVLGNQQERNSLIAKPRDNLFLRRNSYSVPLCKQSTIINTLVVKCCHYTLLHMTIEHYWFTINSFIFSSAETKVADRLWSCQSVCWWQSSLIHFTEWPKTVLGKLTLTHKLVVCLKSPLETCFTWSLLIISTAGNQVFVNMEDTNNMNKASAGSHHLRASFFPHLYLPFL